MLSRTQDEALPAACIYATIQCFKAAYMPSSEGPLCCIYAMMHWRQILVYASTLYIFDSIPASIYAVTYARPSFTRHLHICYHIVRKKYHICQVCRVNCVAYMFWCSLLSFPSIYATTFTWSNFSSPLHICYHTLFVKQHICHSVHNYYQHICRYVFVLACHNSILMSYCQIRMIRIYAAYMPLFGVHSHSFWIIIGLSPFFLLSTMTSHSNSIYALYD